MSNPNSHKVQIFNHAGDETGATFAVELVKAPGADCKSFQVQTIRYDSRGTTAGTRAYRAGLVVLLERIGALGLLIDDVQVASAPAMKLPEDARRLSLTGRQYPIEMLDEDGEAMRKRINTAAAKVGRAPGAKGGGNGTKRLRIFLSATGCLNAELESLLSGGVAFQMGAA